jgi:molybdopterin converting factor small subunit
MDVKVKLFGPLSRHFEGYNSQTGIDVSLPDGARVKDLLAHLEVTENHGYMVTVDSRIKKPEDRLNHGDILQILPAISGG